MSEQLFFIHYSGRSSHFYEGHSDLPALDKKLQSKKDKYSKLGKIHPKNPDPGGKITFSNYQRRMWQRVTLKVNFDKCIFKNTFLKTHFDHVAGIEGGQRVTLKEHFEKYSLRNTF